MGDYFARMIAQALDSGTEIRPDLGSRFAPGPELSAEAPPDPLANLNWGVQERPDDMSPANAVSIPTTREKIAQRQPQSGSPAHKASEAEFAHATPLPGRETDNPVIQRLVDSAGVESSVLSGTDDSSPQTNDNDEARPKLPSKQQAADNSSTAAASAQVVRPEGASAERTILSSERGATDLAAEQRNGNDDLPARSPSTDDAAVANERLVISGRPAVHGAQDNADSPMARDALQTSASAERTARKYPQAPVDDPERTPRTKVLQEFADSSQSAVLTSEPDPAVGASEPPTLRTNSATPPHQAQPVQNAPSTATTSASAVSIPATSEEVAQRRPQSGSPAHEGSEAGFARAAPLPGRETENLVIQRLVDSAGVESSMLSGTEGASQATNDHDEAQPRLPSKQQAADNELTAASALVARPQGASAERTNVSSARRATDLPAEQTTANDDPSARSPSTGDPADSGERLVIPARPAVHRAQDDADSPMARDTVRTSASAELTARTSPQAPGDSSLANRTYAGRHGAEARTPDDKPVLQKNHGGSSFSATQRNPQQRVIQEFADSPQSQALTSTPGPAAGASQPSPLSISSATPPNADQTYLEAGKSRLAEKSTTETSTSALPPTRRRYKPVYPNESGIMGLDTDHGNAGAESVARDAPQTEFFQGEKERRRSGFPSSRRSPQPAENHPPDVRITIGRIKVEAPSAETPTRKPGRPKPSLSVHNYLERRRGGRT